MGIQVRSEAGADCWPWSRGLLDLHAIEPAEVLTTVGQYLHRLFTGIAARLARTSEGESRTMPDEITLRPVTADDLELFEREFSGQRGAGPYQWFGFRSQVALRRRFAETGLPGPDGGVLSVAEADRTVGRVE